MKSFLKFLPIAAAVMLATSCSKDDNDNAPANGRDGVHTVSTSTIPFTIRVNTGRSLKKVGYAESTKDDEEGWYNITFSNDDVEKLEMKIYTGEITNENNLLTTLTLKNATTGEFTGTVETAPAADADLTAVITTDGNSLVTSSNKSLAELLATCAHTFLGTFKYGAAEVDLTDQNAYLAITYFESDKIDLNGSTIDLTDNKVWVAVPANAEVTSQALGISKPAKEVAPGTIYTVDRYFTPMAFSVSPTKKVYFSSGNLQYNPAQYKWQFAAHQYDICIKADNNDVSSMYNEDYDGWIDLFGWGTWLNGYGIEEPYETEPFDPTQPFDPEQPFNQPTYIWSGNSAIGENWTTLSEVEWEYLFSNATHGEGKVAGVNGIILFPDDWTYPADLSNTSPSEDKFISGKSAWANTYTDEDWAKMEAKGAVFLPAAGHRLGRGVDDVGDGYYWSSSAFMEGFAYYLYFGSDDGRPIKGHYGYYGLSVRLVRPL